MTALSAPWRLVAEPMEERILHSVDVTPLLGADLDTLHGQVHAEVASEASSRGREIVFVDASLPDTETLLSDLAQQGLAGRPIEIVRIESGTDGLSLISETLAGRSGIDAVHVLAHGSDARLKIGSSVLDAQTLMQRAGEIAAWAGALTEDADLLLYGCDLAEAEAGQQLVQDLAALTGADVAASLDLTGAATSGGNWVLEYRTAAIEAPVAPSAAAQAQWQNVMATYVVTTTQDRASVGTNGLLEGSLRWAIAKANANPGTDTIVFQVNGVFRIDSSVEAGSINLSGDFDIIDSVNIVGNGAGNTVIESNGLFRVFQVFGGNVNLSGLTIQGGSANQGGGILVASGATLSLTDVVVRDNVGRGGDSQGAGIYSDGALSLLRTVVRDNGDASSGDATGAGIYLASNGSLTAVDVEIRDNLADGQSGGGLYIAGNKAVTLERVTLAGNRAEDGGGIWNASSNTRLVNVTVSDNAASDDGGGIYAHRPLLLDHVTIAGNAAGNDGASGGGVFAAGSGTVIRNSLLAQNTGGNTNRALTSEGHNLSDDDSPGFTATGDLKNLPAGLGLLADNGGFTRTRAIGSGSAALNAANPSSTLLADQRGVVYSTAGADIGAYELNPSGAAPGISSVADQVIDEDAALTALAFTVTDAETPAADLVVTATSSNTALVPSTNIILGGSGNNRIVTVVPEAENNDGNSGGPTRVTLTVSDGTNTRSTSFLVSVRAVNDAPSGEVLISGTAEQGQTLRASHTLSDADGLGTISYQWRADGDAISGATGSTFRLGQAQVGKLITVSASYVDGVGKSERVDSAATASVSNVNDAPQVARAIPNQSAREDALYTFTLPSGTFSDVDIGDSLSYRAEQSSGAALPNWLRFDRAARSFSGTPSDADVGTVTVRVFASDRANATVYDDFTLTVTNVDDPPELNRQIADQAVDEDTQFSLTLPADTFTDDSDGALRYQAQLSSGASLPAWLSFNATTRTFSGTPTNEHVGSITVRVTATDTANASSFVDFRLTVANVNDAPVINRTIADRSTREDAVFSFTVPADTFRDVDAGDALRYTADLASGGALPSWLSFDAATRTFSGTATNADVGSITLRVTASDRANDSVSDEFRLTVTNVNDAPVLSQSIADQSATEDSAFSFTVPAKTFSDVDAGDALRYTADLASGGALPAWLSFDAATRTFSGTPGNEDVGELTLRITATDGADATAFGDFTLTVVNVNDVPVLSESIADQSATEDTPFSFTVPAETFSDIDAGDTLRYTAELASGHALPSWLLFDSATRTFSGTPANADVGSITVRITATDGANATASDELTLTVLNVDDAPVLSSPIADQSTTEDTLFSFTVPEATFSDIDAGDALRYTAESSSGGALPAWLSFDSATRTFSGTPANADVGSVSVRITATDDASATATDEFTLTVTNVNDAPVLSKPIADQSATEDTPFSFSVPEESFSDIDAGERLHYTAELASGAALPSWLSFDAQTRSFSGTPSNADVGSITVRVTAADGANATASDEFSLTVANVNDAPVLSSPIADQSANEDRPFGFTVPAEAFGDVDAGDTLRYTADLASGGTLPAWLSFDAQTRTFIGTPVNGDVGMLSLRLTATDGAGASAVTLFTLTVVNTNDGPVAAQPVVERSATAGERLLFELPQASFRDDDVGDTLTYSATLSDGSPLPDWLEFDGATRIFTVSPGTGNLGVTGIRVVATDAAGAAAEASFALSVKPAPAVVEEVKRDIEASERVPDAAAPASAEAALPDLPPSTPPTVAPTRPSEREEPLAEVPVLNNTPPRQAPPTEGATTTDRLSSRADAVLAAALVPGYETLGSATLGQLLQSDDLLRKLEELQRQLLSPGDDRQLSYASSIAVTGSVSVGYIVWLVRGGVLVSSMLSALPVWQMVDPLPVLAAAGGAKRPAKAGATDDADVERLFDKAEDADTARQAPAQDTASVNASTREKSPSMEPTR